MDDGGVREGAAPGEPGARRGDRRDRVARPHPRPPRQRDQPRAVPAGALRGRAPAARPAEPSRDRQDADRVGLALAPPARARRAAHRRGARRRAARRGAGVGAGRARGDTAPRQLGAVQPAVQRDGRHHLPLPPAEEPRRRTPADRRSRQPRRPPRAARPRWHSRRDRRAPARRHRRRAARSGAGRGRRRVRAVLRRARTDDDAAREARRPHRPGRPVRRLRATARHPWLAGAFRRRRTGHRRRRQGAGPRRR